MGGLEDGTAATRRWMDFEDFIEKMVAHLSGSGGVNLEDVLTAAKNVDEYYGMIRRRTHIALNLEETIEELKKENQQTWGEFLYLARESCHSLELKELSPFKDRMIVTFDYSFGAFNIDGYFCLREPTRRIIIDRWSKVRNESGKFLGALPTAKSKRGSKPIWINCDKPRRKKI